MIRSERGELRFAPGGDLRDQRGGSWSVEGDLGVLHARIEDGALLDARYPDGLARSWSALTCSSAGDVLLSAAPGWEFSDWGGQDHLDGGSHGSLHRSDSLGALMWSGLGPDSADARALWSLQDIVPMVREHFGLPPLENPLLPLPPVTDELSVVARPTLGDPGPGRAARGAQLDPARALRARRGHRLRRQPRHLHPGRRDAALRPPPPSLAFLAGVTNNFLLNRRWTFRVSHGHRGHQALRFLAVSLAAFAVSLLVLTGLVELAGLPEILAQAIAVVAGLPVNFLGQKLWSFAS